MAVAATSVQPAAACSQPDTWSVAAAFNLAANGRLPATYPPIPASTGVTAIPPSVLMAVGWVESGWRQFTVDGRPLLSPDFGYGIMQITSGMAGAFGNVGGSISPDEQSRIATDYTYNIGYGAKMLAQKWANAPRIGNGDPSVVEHWYYALWAYNGWGWVNNPNNPRFSRSGTPATNPSTFPYQERVLYLVAHPPRDRDGNPLWPAVSVTLPPRKSIGSSAGPLHELTHVHRQRPPGLAAVYHPQPVVPLRSSAGERVSVTVTNTGTEPWGISGSTGVSLVYHLFTATGDPWHPFSPFSNGVVAFSQGTTHLSHVLTPGHSETLHTTVRAPSVPGNYRVVWDLEEGDAVWFSQRGALPRAEPLRVLKTGQTVNPITPTPSATAGPTENLRYVADTSIPDGVTVGARAVLRKGWLVLDNGADWPRQWALHLVSGVPFGARTIPVPATRSCRTANIVATLRAPAKPGRYSSAWRMQDAHGHRFGERLTLVVVVRGPPGPTPTPTPSPTRGPRSHPTGTPTPLG